jgi:putative transposase
VRYAFIARHRPIWAVDRMCRMLDVSRSGFHEWHTRKPCARAIENERLTTRIRTFHALSGRSYGSPRICRDLQEAGERIGENRVARLMRRAGIEALRRKRRRPVDEGVRPECAIAGNLLARQFDAEAPNCKWVADFTYIDTAEGWLYLAVVLDLFSRRVVGWSMKPEMTSQLVMDALVMAIWRRGKPKELLHHSDQGSQYAAEDFQRLLAHHGIQCSMSRKGDCWDNAAMESFFASLKKERVYTKQRYRTHDEGRADIFEYIEGFYNPRRRHSTLGQVSPAEFERQFSTQCT